MSTAGLINRYVWFVTTIYNRGPITLEEIQYRFESHFGRGEELSERQFHRYTDAVEELFDIEIKYSRTKRGLKTRRNGIRVLPTPYPLPTKSTKLTIVKLNFLLLWVQSNKVFSEVSPVKSEPL